MVGGGRSSSSVINFWPVSIFAIMSLTLGRFFLEFLDFCAGGEAVFSFSSLSQFVSSFELRFRLGLERDGDLLLFDLEGLLHILLFSSTLFSRSLELSDLREDSETLGGLPGWLGLEEFEFELWK